MCNIISWCQQNIERSLTVNPVVGGSFPGIDVFSSFQFLATKTLKGQKFLILSTLFTLKIQFLWNIFIMIFRIFIFSILSHFLRTTAPPPGFNAAPNLLAKSALVHNYGVFYVIATSVWAPSCLNLDISVMLSFRHPSYNRPWPQMWFTTCSTKHGDWRHEPSFGQCRFHLRWNLPCLLTPRAQFLHGLKNLGLKCICGSVRP